MQVIFVATGNRLADIPAPLLDRLEVISLPGYTQDEKVHIAEVRRLAPSGLLSRMCAALCKPAAVQAPRLRYLAEPGLTSCFSIRCLPLRASCWTGLSKDAIFRPVASAWDVPAQQVLLHVRRQWQQQQQQDWALAKLQHGARQGFAMFWGQMQARAPGAKKFWPFNRPVGDSLL